MSFDPNLRFVIVSASQHLKPKVVAESGLDEMARAWQHLASSVTAVDVATGTVAWQDEFDGGLVGGTSSTAGGVTFVGEGDGHFDALNTKTGERLWQFQTGSGVNAPPVIFQVKNDEYVAVASGGNQQLGTALGDAVFVFRLYDR
jgi:glucose dehydrogenase